MVQQVTGWLEQLAPEKALLTALGLTEYTILFESLNNVFDNFGTQEVTPAAQNFFLTNLQNLVELRLKENLEELVKLADFLTKSIQSTLLNEEQKATVEITLLAAVNSEIENLRLQDAIKKALDQEAFDDKITGISTIVDESGQKAVDDETEDIFNDALGLLFTIRPITDKDDLISLQDLLNKALDSTLLTDEQKENIRNNFLPAIASDIKTLDLQQRIKDIMAIPDYNERMAALEKLLGELAGQELDPTTQTLLSDALQNLYDNRPTDDPDALKKLNDMLNGLTGTELIPDDFDDAIKNTLIPGVTKDIGILDLRDRINDAINLPDYTDRMNALNDILGELAGQELDPTTQNLLSDGMKNLYDNRPTDDPNALKTLTGMLGGLTGTELIPDDFDDMIGSTFMPGVNKDIGTLDLRDRINDATGMPGYDDRMNALNDILKELTGQELDPTTQTLLADGMNNLYTYRPIEDPDALKNLTDMLGILSGTELIPDDFNTMIGTTLMPGVNKDLGTLDLRDRINNISGMPGYDDRMNELNKILGELAGQELDPTTQTILSTGLQDLYDARPLDPTALTNLADIMNQVKDTDLITPDMTTKIDTDIMPGLTKDKDKADIHKGINDAMGMPGYDDKLDLFKDLIDKAGDKDLDDATKELLSKGLQDLYDARPIDPTTLTTLGGLMDSAKDTGVVSDDMATTIDEDIMPGLTEDKDKADIQKALTDIMAITDPNARINALLDFIRRFADKELDPETQKILILILQNLYDTRTLDPTLLNNLANLMNTVKNTDLIPDDMATKIDREIIPGITGDKDKANMQNELNNILANPDYNTRMRLLNDFIKRYGDKDLDPTTKNLLSRGLQNLYDTRPLDPTALANLGDIMTQAKDTDLITPDMTTKIDTTLMPGIEDDKDKALTQDEIKKILAIPDYGTRLGSLDDFIKRTEDKELAPETKTLVSQALQDLYDARPLDPSTITKLTDVIDIAKGADLVPEVMVTKIETDILPGLEEDKDKADVAKDVADAGKVTDPNTLINTLNKILTDSAGKPIDPQTQILLNNLLNRLFGQRTLDPTLLAKLKDLLTRAQQSDLLDPTQQTTIQTTLMPTLTQDTQMLAIINRIKQVLAQPDYNTKVTGLTVIIQETGGQLFTTPVHNVFANGLQALFNERPEGDQTLLRVLLILLQNSLPSGLINQPQKTYVQTNLIPAVQANLSVFLFEQEIANAMAQPTIIARIDGVAAVTQKYAQTRIPDSMKEVLAEALQTLFDSRYAQGVEEKILKKVKKKKKKKKKAKKKKKKKKKKVKKVKKKKKKKVKKKKKRKKKKKKKKKTKRKKKRTKKGATK